MYFLCLLIPLFTCLHLFLQHRSTIEFAREVTEVKAQDDALNHLENMFSGTDMMEENAAPQGIAISGAIADPVQGSGKEVLYLASRVSTLPLYQE